MGLGLVKTKHRITSIENTEKTTKAMELIAMVKLRRFLDAYEKEKQYSEEFLSLMGVIFAHDKLAASHYAKVNEKAEKSLYIVITSNLGLCGAYNNQLFKFVDTFVSPKEEIAPIGNKGIHHFERSDTFKNINQEYACIDLSTDMEVLHALAKKLKEEFNQGKYRSINIVYTRYVNSLKSVPTSFQLLPVQVPYEAWDGESYCPPEFDESPRTLIHELMPSYLVAMVYGRLIESELSEQAMRRTAMDNANDNADELLSKLRIEYNKARQNAITQEITEVVGGANAND